TYKWFVRYYAPGGQTGAWSSPLQFLVATIAPVLHGPVPLTGGTEVFAWTDVAGATSYDIWVDDKTTGQSPFYRNKLVLPPTGAGDNFTTVSSIFKPGHLSWWWVRANGPSGYIGDWSQISAFIYSP